MQNRSPQAVITLLSFALLFVAACTYLPPAHPTSPLAPAVIAQAILTKDEAIKRVTTNMPDAEVLDVRLLYLDEAYRSVTGAMGNYQAQGYHSDDPAWVVTVRSKEVAKMPMASAGVTIMTTIVTAVDGEGSVMIMLVEENVASHLQQLQALPDRTGQLVIIPRPSPLHPTLIPYPTATPVPMP